MAAKLEEALLSIRFAWDLSTPAKDIVDKVRKQDLTSIQILEGKCKEQVLALAFKLARNLKIPAVVALLLSGRTSILNQVLKKENPLARKVDGVVDLSPDGTIVDLVLGIALAHTNACILNKLDAKSCKPYVKEDPGESSSGDFDVKVKRLEDWDSGTSDNSQFKVLSRWDESLQNLKPRLDSGEWEEVSTKSRKKAFPATVVVMAKEVVVKEEVEKSYSGTSPPGDDAEYSCEIARKLLECLLLFSPRLAGHTLSPHLPPLLRASKESDEALVCLLLDNTASNKLKIFVNEKDADGNTALHWALRQATPVNGRAVNSQVVRRLLKAGANVMTGNNLGATPVHTAAGHGHIEALSDILEKDSSGVNVLALTKETPLHYAVKNNHIACAFLLLKHGANRNVASSRNQKPIQLAPSVEMKYLLLEDDKVLKENTWESFKPILLSSASSSSLYSLAMQSQTHFPSIADALGFHQVAQDGSPIDWLSAQTLAINSRDFGGDMDFFGGKESVNLPQYKTVMCRFFASSEGCGWGTKCHFAHSEEELMGAERIDGHLMGMGGSLSDDGSDQSIKNFKTKLCTHHEKTGKCPHGAKCTFAHGMVELRGALSSAAICIRPPIGIDTRPSSANSLGSSTGSEKGDDYMSARKVFVGGLPHYIQSDELQEFFEGEFGKVVDAVVIFGVDTDGKVRSRGFGFVVFHDPRHANIACKRHYLPFRGKKVEVKRATARVDYADEPIRFPSGASSPIPPPSSSQHSPTFRPSSPIVGRPKEPLPQAVPQQAWSLPPLAVDSLRKPSQELSPSNSMSLSDCASSLSSEMNHVMPQYGAPPLSHLSLNRNGSSPLQNSSRSQFANFGPLFSSLDSGLDRSSFSLDSGAASFSPSPGYTSPSNSSNALNHFSMNGSGSVPYSNGTMSFDGPVAGHDMDLPSSQSFFSNIPGPSLYPHESNHVAPAADDEEFSELLAMLSDTK